MTTTVHNGFFIFSVVIMKADLALSELLQVKFFVKLRLLLVLAIIGLDLLVGGES